MSERTYVPLGDVAAACGVSTHRLLNRFWPEDWAVPRDFRLLPRSSTVLITEASLPQLVAALREGGQPVAAVRLELWCAEIATPETHEEFVARHTVTPAAPEAPWYQKGQFE